MRKEPLMVMSLIGLTGYVVFHGHRLNESCWLCPYRGWAFAGSSILLGGYMAVTESDD